MKLRNPGEPQRQTEANQQRTQKVLERYHGKIALLSSWEKMPDDVQADNHEYILELRRIIRNTKNYLLHRADAKIKL